MSEGTPPVSRDFWEIERAVGGRSRSRRRVGRMGVREGMMGADVECRDGLDGVAEGDGGGCKDCSGGGCREDVSIYCTSTWSR